MKRISTYALILLTSLSLMALRAQLISGGPRKSPSSENSGQRDWPVYGGNPQDTRYSPLAQINRSNVSQLQVAWRYDTGETDEKGGLQTNPLVVNGVLYAYTPSQKVIALDAATGKLLWKFDSGVGGTEPARGLAYWREDSRDDGRNIGSDHQAAQSARKMRAPQSSGRIFAGIMNYVYALDPTTGEPIESFGKHGRIDLRENLGRDPAKQSLAMTAPGVVYRDLLIVGELEPETLPAPPGDIRAYDVRTGAMRWIFHTIPHPGEFGYETWPKDAWEYTGAANNWAGMALDPDRGIVYVPTGSAAFDFYGANRVGDDLFANCLIALDAATGKRLWHFQAVHHDLWDRDFPSPPTLVTVERDARKVDAVAQTSKQGFVFLFDRATGRPLFPMTNHPYPPSTVPGEAAAGEQPLPDKPAPYARQILTEDMLTTRTPEAHQWAVEQFRKFRSQGQFVPFSAGKDTVIFPGFDGGAEWGGSAVDPETGILYVNANDLAWTGGLAEIKPGISGVRALYLNRCSICHGENMAGSPPQFPSLIGVAKRRTPGEITALLRKGSGRMPAFTDLSGDQVSALVEYLTSGEDRELANAAAAAPDMNYAFTGYKRFLDPEGYPAVEPPWGTLNAINLNTGEYVWKIPFGEYPELAAKGMKNTGTENYGGPVITAGGLVFIGATSYDRKMHAYDKSTGKLLWEATLPFAGNATPATYEVNGRQYVVIAAGGGRPRGTPAGGSYVAFALPRPGTD
jgi:quinoprotein glucose dehydrogenase